MGQFSPTWGNVHDRDEMGRGDWPGISLPWPKVLALDQNIDADQEAKTTTETPEKVSEP